MMRLPLSWFRMGMSSAKVRRAFPAGTRARGKEPCSAGTSEYSGGLSEGSGAVGVLLAMMLMMSRLMTRLRIVGTGEREARSNWD